MSSPSMRKRPEDCSDGLIAAAEYVRMSTDHQRYSTENQSASIHAYALSHGMDIVKTYRDEGKSGLDIGGRDALRRLLDDVQAGNIQFQVILVYDVSRWGRFQNTDESAHYEYLCTSSGIQVVYCAEPFENDGSPMATIYKGIKRSMAGEYSRELSQKVFAGQCRLVEKGFHQGGPAGYGLRRALIDEKNEFKAELSRGQQKSIQTDRVILIPGPEAEIVVVQNIYHQFIHSGMNEREIADALNADGVLTDFDRPWSRGCVHEVLTNEKYIGNNVYNKTSSKLRKRISRNPPDKWIRCDGAFQGIISPELFTCAREIILQRSHRLDDAQMLELLRALLQKAGSLSGMLIDEQDNMPSSTVYISRFGGLLRAYTLIGYAPDRDYRYLDINRSLRQLHPQVFEAVIKHLENAGASVEISAQNDVLTINDEWTASVVIARCHSTPAGTLRWKLRFDISLAPDITIAVRMEQANRQVRDYYLVPLIDMGAWPQKMAEENSPLIDSYCFATLDVLDGLAARCSLKEACR
ncbi:putative Recombinase [Pseudomonas syringae pv. pisi]|uniref:Putative Recombinase n=3 Tax=Pseudomonas TaxID=286 RepID=A0A3M2XFF9_PSESJ|nr:putative Recombinase [Pseudomonas syringae pv. pisi]RML62517.1 putative Recombinase [Pseudomonas syringae pv. pisi]RMO25891.1 putative Recombinase [Pseudomonas syringae pv. pisi]RMU85819.1 putative Recombinase [Pseudomonas savastanoi pv. phaseolicola]RMV58145.1 putative Recombinase [Pseudomonas syringae pv. pisi]